MDSSPFDSLQSFTAGPGCTGRFYSLASLEKAGIGEVSRLPVTLRIVLEAVLRHCDGVRITEKDVAALAGWKPQAERTAEIPFVVARILLQDFSGVPLIVDLAAMRSALARMGRDPSVVEPLVPVHMVIDHSVQVDYWSSSEAPRLNMQKEFERNQERYEFSKWGMQAFEKLSIIPPGTGIVHQVNLEHLAKGVLEKDGVWYPDTVLGTDSHTTMINGLGVVGWGVGGIEAEAGMLGQPVYFLTPDVVGVNLTGRLAEGVTATDLALYVTQLLRAAKVVGKFVEFHGEGAASLALPDRATIANMSPEYGATMGYFPVDEETCRYLLSTGRPPELVDAVRAYFEAQGLFGIPNAGDCDYTSVVELDLAKVPASVAGPKRPHDRIDLAELKPRFREILSKPVAEGGYGKPAAAARAEGGGKNGSVADGDVIIAAITSCTNTSNPSVMLAAGLVAKKALERGLKVPAKVKTSLSPGSRAVTEYLQKAGLQEALDRIGFGTVGYGCMTCIGQSGPLDPRVEDAVVKNDVVAASVLSGNRNFEARVHQNVRANFLMSPPLVVAFALAGRVDIDVANEPIGTGKDGKPVFLRDIWPSPEEIREALVSAADPETYRRLYADVTKQNVLWNAIEAPEGQVYRWDAASTYIQEPPFFLDFGMHPSPVADVRGARALALLGDSVTTDHISPAGAIKPASPAGEYLRGLGVEPEDFNAYGTRRGNDRVMTRGTFANVRLKNLMVPGVEGGVTVHQPSRERMSIFDAAMRYEKERIPLVVLAGAEYGTGSSRDWAAKGAGLLGVRAVVAKSFERIHRSNLVGMGVLPCQFPAGMGIETLALDGSETFDITGIETMAPGGQVTLAVHRANGKTEEFALTVRIETPVEMEYYRHGGILPYVLRQLITQEEPVGA